jgi:transcriptional regulator of acetoin/glycerol metabolism
MLDFRRSAWADCFSFFVFDLMPSATKSLAHQLFRIQALDLILDTSKSIPPHIHTSGNIFKHHQKEANIPATFLRHYPAYKNKQLNVSELARVCDISRTTVYKYIGLLEA